AGRRQDFARGGDSICVRGFEVGEWHGAEALLAELRAARRSERAWSAAMAALRSSGAGACAIQRCRSNPARGASPGDLFASGPHMTIERRRFLQGALAAPLMLSSAAA